MTTLASFGENAAYVADLLSLFQTDPRLVPSEWHAILGNGVSSSSDVTESRSGIDVSAAVAGTSAVRAFRSFGHLFAATSPITSPTNPRLIRRDPVTLPVTLAPDTIVPTLGFRGTTTLPLGQLISELRASYCGSVAVQAAHISDPVEQHWWWERFEGSRPRMSREQATRALQRLVETERIEAGLHKKFVGAKRFSAQGTDSFLPLIDRVLHVLALRGRREAIIGMAHRGRLSLLCNLLGKPLEQLFAEFSDLTSATIEGSGDVKYHMGYRGTITFPDGASIAAELLPNPSHLEAVNPVVAGFSRALQDRVFQGQREAVIPILIHGDAAVAGQGVVPEVLNLSRLKGYETGGTFHLVINNQVGFTTNSEDARSMFHALDWAVAIEAPILRVNNDDVPAVLWAAEVAAEYLATFGRDVVIDLVGTRKYGHNEGDDPTFTQPLVYEEIKERAPTYITFGATAAAEGLLPESAVADEESRFDARFEGAATRVVPAGECCSLSGKLNSKELPTAVPAQELDRIAKALLVTPSDFAPHKKLLSILEKRVESYLKDTGAEWGLAENLAFGSLLNEGISIRLTGQDVERATFSHRHAVFNDVSVPGKKHVPLNALGKEGAALAIFNSPLSEYAVMGFEFGYAAAAPEMLVLWEAQFGDFANGAQIVIDQFLASAETKWGQRSGLTLLLPHGYEGQGPEHSSARLERFLQLAAEDTMTVCYPSTAAQYFHLLRRQAKRGVKRPLVIMTPKSLLRNPAAAASRTELHSGSFQSVIAEGPAKASRGVVCYGKVYHDLIAALPTLREESRVIRIEELAPFPAARVKSALAGCSEILYVQEEPLNMGGWWHLGEGLRDLGLSPIYCGRPRLASPATGSGKFHQKEQQRIIAEVKAFVEGAGRKKGR